MDESARSLTNLQRVGNNFSLEGMARGVDYISKKFSALGIIGITTLQNITNSALNAGKRIVSALTIDPIKMGFNEYETKINAIQTILTNTRSKGTTIDQVNDALAELNTYADPEALTFSWEATTTPVPVTGAKPTAHLVIDSTRTDATKLKAIEDILYGTDGVDPRLLLPDEVKAILESAAPSDVALTSIVPADDATAVALDSNIVLTFNNKIASESIVVTSNAGAIVEGTKTWDSEGKVLTFNPTTNLTASTTYIVGVVSVIDIYGKKLATTVKNFATTA